jgi:hypothetical protein
MAGRLYVPVFQRGHLVGYQGRWAGELDWGAAGVPKYYTRPGMRKAQLVYNLDQAACRPVVAVCEGVTDVWRAGPAGVALFGKAASAAQLRLLVHTWYERHAVVLLDGDAAAEARVLGERLRPFFAGRLVLAFLPPEKDPGSCSREELWGRVRAAASDQGVSLPACSEAAP